MRAYQRIARIHRTHKRWEEATAAVNRGIELYHELPSQADAVLAENAVSISAMYGTLKEIETKLARKRVKR
jgi:hypothetical protein